LPSKTESCYLKIWTNIKNICTEFEQVLNINIIHLDFEIAVQKTFTGVKVKGCRFHFHKLYGGKSNQFITFDGHIIKIIMKQVSG